MDHKALKQDMTYALKKLQKDGKVLTAHGDNLSIKDGAFVELGYMDVLEAFIIMKGYFPSEEHLHQYYDKWQAPNGEWYSFSWFFHETYNMSLLDLLVKETQISKNDWYAFLDGFDNVVSYEKNDFYNVGVYLREKFMPEGMRLEPLNPVVQGEFSLTEKMPNKFVIYSFKGKTAVMEVKCEKLISMLEAPGEYKARILTPETLFEKKKDNTLVPAIYCSHALFDSAADALFKVEKDIESTFERNFRKKGIAYTPADVQAQLLLVKVINL